MQVGFCVWVSVCVWVGGVGVGEGRCLMEHLPVLLWWGGRLACGFLLPDQGLNLTPRGSPVFLFSFANRLLEHGDPVAQVCECSGCFYQGLLVLICLHRLWAFVLCVCSPGPSLTENVISLLPRGWGWGGLSCGEWGSWSLGTRAGVGYPALAVRSSLNHKPFCTWCFHRAVGPPLLCVSHLSFCGRVCLVQ